MNYADLDELWRGRLRLFARLTMYACIVLLVLACTAAPTAQIAPVQTPTPTPIQTPQRGVSTMTAAPSPVQTPAPIQTPQRGVSTMTATPSPTAAPPFNITPPTSIGGDTSAVALSGTLLFVSDTSGRLTVFDRHDPAHLRPLAHVALPQAAHNIQYADGMLYLLSGNALQLVDVHVPEHPQARGRLVLPLNPRTGWKDQLLRASIKGDRVWISSLPYTGAYIDYGVRIVVVDVTDPDHPKKDHAITLSDVLGNDAYVVGDIAYVATPFPSVGPGSPPEPGDVEGLHILDLHNQTTATLISALPLGTAYGVWVFGNYAYVGHAVFTFHSGYTKTANEKLSIVVIRDPKQPRLIGEIDTPDLVSAVHVEGNVAYISNFHKDDSDGDTYIFQIVDIHDPYHPMVQRTLDLKGQTVDLVVADQYVYIAARAGGLQIIDATQPEQAALLDSYGMPGQAYDVRIVDDVAYVRTWAAVEESSSPANFALTLVDIRDPANPVISASYELSGDFDVVNGIACVPGPARGLQIVDVHDPSAPTLLNTFVPDGAAASVRVVSDTAYLVDENGGLSIIDVRDPAHPVLQGRYTANTPLYSVEVSGHVAYVSGPEAGLQIVDVRDPAHPSQISNYPFPSNKWQARVIDNIAYINQRFNGLLQPGLQIVDLRDPAHPQLRAKFGIGVNKIRVIGSTAYVVGEIDIQAGLYLIDLSNPTQPRLSGSYIFDDHGIIEEVGIVDGNAILLIWTNTVHIVDVHDPSKPRLRRKLHLPLAHTVSGYGIAFKDDLAYVAAGESALQIWQLSH